MSTEETKTETQKCSCINDVLAEVKQRIINEKGQQKGFKIQRIYWEYTSIFPILRMYSNIITDYTFEKKDGTESRIQHLHSSIIFSYCPFCGQKINTGKEDNKK